MEQEQLNQVQMTGQDAQSNNQMEPPYQDAAQGPQVNIDHISDRNTAQLNQNANQNVISYGASTSQNYADDQFSNFDQQTGQINQYSPQINGQNDFYIMDIVGGGCQRQSNTPGASRQVAVMHPTKPVVAYSAGCMIIVYDLMSDCKINLAGHQHDVYALAFTPNGESLMSVDFNKNAELQDNSNVQGGVNQDPTSVIQLWDWQRGVCIQETAIPRYQNLAMMLAPPQAAGGLSNLNISNDQSFLPHFGPLSSRRNNLSNNLSDEAVCHIQLNFDKSGTLFMVLESSPLKIGGGYRVTLWSLTKTNVIEMISSMELELQCPCIDLCFLPRTQIDILTAQRQASQSNHSAHVFLNSKLPFLTLERNCIKIWEYSQGNANLKKRIHIKQNIVQFKMADLTGFFIILGENGKLLILDSQGEFVSTIQREGVFYTQIGIAHDKLMLGTDKGIIQVFHVASLQPVSDIPYQLSFIQKFSLNQDGNKSIDDQLNLQKVGPPVCAIQCTLNLRFLWIQYTDGSFAVVDRTFNNPRQAILGYSCGHFESISSLQWITPKNEQISSYDHMTRNMIGSLDSQQIADQQFVTCSHDLSIHVWKHYGDRWAFSYIDVAKCFDQCLSFQRKQCDRSTKDLLLTAMCLYPRSNNLVVADSKGFIRIFQLVNNGAYLLATHKLPRSKDVKAERALNLSEIPHASRIQIDDNSLDLIKEIFITNNENTAVITFSSGLISLYDIKNSYSWVGDIDEVQSQNFNTMNAANNHSITTKIIEVLQPQNQHFKRGSSYAQDEQPIPFPDANRGGLNQQSSIYSSYASNLKILNLKTPNQIQMQLVDVKGSKVTRSSLCQYAISEGRITGFDVHPSKDYLLITSSKGRIYVYRIDTGELRGTIKIPLNANGCHIDPSGLYVLIKVPAFTNQNAANLMENNQNQSLSTHFGANEKDLSRNTVLMYEIGTGLPAAEICSVFQINDMKFSNDARYLTLVSSCGAVSVWALGMHIHQNIKQVLDAMRLQSDFWFNYPIFLPDYQLFNQNQLSSPVPYQALDDTKTSIKNTNFDRNLIRAPQHAKITSNQTVLNTGNMNRNQIPGSHVQFQKYSDKSPSQSYDIMPTQYPYNQISNPQIAMQNQNSQSFKRIYPQQIEANYSNQNYPPQKQSHFQNEQRFMRSQQQQNMNAYPVSHGNYNVNQQQAYVTSQMAQTGNLYHPQAQNHYQQQSLMSYQPPQYPVQGSGQKYQNPNYFIHDQLTHISSDRQNHVIPSYDQTPIDNMRAYNNQNLLNNYSTSNDHINLVDQNENRQAFYPYPSGVQKQQQHNMVPFYPPQQQQRGFARNLQYQQQRLVSPQYSQEQATATLLGQNLYNLDQQVAPNMMGNYPQNDQIIRNDREQIYQNVIGDNKFEGVPHNPPGSAISVPQTKVSFNQQPNVDGYDNQNYITPNLGEPAPLNQSQFLYNQPLNATVNRNEENGQKPNQRNPTFIKYMDNSPKNHQPNYSAQQNPMDATRSQNNSLTPPRAVHTYNRTHQFDHSLNDRDQFTNTQQQVDGYMGQSIQQDIDKKKLIVIRQNSNDKLPSNLNDQERPSTELQGEEPEIDQQEFKPVGFSNTLTQQELVRRGLKPDPVGIDNSDRGSLQAQRGQGLPDSSVTAQLQQELDGMNKYLQGVKVPQNIGANINNGMAYTLKNLKQDEQTMNYQREVGKPQNAIASLYEGAKQQNIQALAEPRVIAPMRQIYGKQADLPPVQNDFSVKSKKSDTNDLVDEMYENINDFEAKLQLGR